MSRVYSIFWKPHWIDLDKSESFTCLGVGRGRAGSTENIPFFQGLRHADENGGGDGDQAAAKSGFSSEGNPYQKPKTQRIWPAIFLKMGDYPPHSQKWGDASPHPPCGGAPAFSKPIVWFKPIACRDHNSHKILGFHCGGKCRSLGRQSARLRGQAPAVNMLDELLHVNMLDPAPTGPPATTTFGCLTSSTLVRSDP